MTTAELGKASDPSTSDSAAARSLTGLLRPHLGSFAAVVMTPARLREQREFDGAMGEGSHDELLRRGGRYADYWNISMTAEVL